MYVFLNTNKLTRHEDIDGVKTGWTNAAGYCLTATKFNDSMRVIGVIMGSITTKIRNSEMLTLLNFGMSNYTVNKQMEKGTVVKTEENINLEPSKLEYKIEEPVNIVTRNGTELGNITYKININYENLTENRDIGNLTVLYNYQVYQVIPLYLDQTIEKTKYFGLFRKILRSMLGV